jgi:predicted kinase
MAIALETCMRGAWRAARRAGGQLTVVELVVFVGLQASGKSTFYASRYRATHVHVSKDLFGRARHKHEKQMRLVTEAIRSGRSVVVDNTNPRKADRAELVALAREHGARPIAVSFTASVGECLQRNATREGKARVPAVAIYTTAKKLEPLSRDEGFDEVLEVRLGDAGFDVRAAVPDGRARVEPPTPA